MTEESFSDHLVVVVLSGRIQLALLSEAGKTTPAAEAVDQTDRR
jgi:hypothetical protein